MSLRKDLKRQMMYFADNLERKSSMLKNQMNAAEISISLLINEKRINNSTSLYTKSIAIKSTYNIVTTSD